MYHVTKFAGRFSLCTLALAATVVACSDMPTTPNAPIRPSPSLSTATGIPTGRTVVIFKDTAAVPAAGLALLTSLGATGVSTKWNDIGVAVVTGLSAQGLASVRASNLVEAAGNDRILNWLPNVKVGGTIDAGAGVGSFARGAPQNARYYVDGTQWPMRIIKADVAWAAGFLGTPTTRVAIVDTGLDYDHRELKGLVDKAASTSFANIIVGEAGVEVNVPYEPQLPGDEPYMDNHFHGTHVGGTIASNNISVAGVAPNVTLIAVKVLSATGSGTFESVASGITHASGPANADVINMSLGAEVDPREDGVPALLKFMSRVIKKAEKNGTIVISAAGNSSLNLDQGFVVATPCEESTICVSATGPLLQQNFDQAASYTNFGITAIDVAAPGGNATDDDSQYQTEDLVIGACSRRASEQTLNVCRANTDGVVYFYAFAAGTSMATPHVVGEAAQIKSQNPTLSVKGIRDRILKTADDVQAPGRDVYTNNGRINVARALGLQ